MKAEVDYGTTHIEFTIERAARKTLAIEVHPDTSVQVIAPIDTSVDAIKQKVLGRSKWIAQQQQYFEQFLPRAPQQEYVSGETHLYLGRRYLLKIRTSSEMSVKLTGGELQVFLPDVSNKNSTKRLLAGWYYEHARKKFSNCMLKSLKKLEKYKLKEPSLEIKRMNKRWGSCTPKGKIILNPEIIKAPSKCIEYVVIHELCHLIHPNHSKEFFALQKTIMPDWEKWKDRLEKNF